MTLIVDGANVVGSVPDGWWRDRRGAALRLRDRLAALSGWEWIVLVVEGQAREIGGRAPIEVLAAAGSGDDAIVAVVRELEGACVVATADRELITRVRALGAEVIGPRQIYGA